MPNLFNHEVKYPATYHFRCKPEMKAAIVARGGGVWLRALVTANLKHEFTAVVEPGAYAPEADLPATSSTRRATPAGSRKRVRRVALDKRKRRRVK